MVSISYSGAEIYSIVIAGKYCQSYTVLTQALMALSSFDLRHRWATSIIIYTVYYDCLVYI